MNKKNICAYCGGLLVKKRVNYEHRWGEKLVAFENVPARECPQCGSVWIAGKVLESMDRVLVSGERPAHRLSIPVWSFARLKLA